MPDDRRPSRAAEYRPTVDRFTVGKLIDHGEAPLEFAKNGSPSYYLKLVTDAGLRTIWGAGLKTALQKSRSQPQLGEQIGVRENNFDPVTVVTRTRNADGLVIAQKQFDSPRPHWIVEKLEEFDLRAAAARTLRDPTASRRESVISYPQLRGAYEILDTGRKLAATKWQRPDTQTRFLAALRETLAATLERGEELPQSSQKRNHEPHKAR